jgi:tetratricopeptide (TPR) repeat protein
MKTCLFLLLAFITFRANAQEWRDSLSVARKAYQNKEYSKAFRYYQSAQKKAPKSVNLSDEMAQSAYKARDFKSAESIYRQSASEKKSPNGRSKSYHNLGNSQMKNKDYQGAIDSYKQALRNNPSDNQTRYNLSEAIRRLKDEQKKQEENKDKNQQDKQEEQDQKDQQDQQNQNGQPKDQKSQNGKNDQKNSGDSKNNQSQSNGKPGNPSKLPNKSVDRMLDNLMKQESATKRKIGGNKGNNATTNSGKDW